jgi:lipoprotein signal peptidase
VDFIQLPNWPIFNVADIAITCSGFWIAYLLLRDIKPFATFGDDDE